VTAPASAPPPDAMEAPGAAGPVSLALKRAIDIVVSALLLLLALPLLLLLAFLIWVEDRGPVFFRQDRIGYRGRAFRVWKFRSMRVNQIPPEELGDIHQGHPMVTRIGHWLRRFKLDELPQLFNVLRGEMSLVGPRPTIPEQVARYGPFERRRLLMPPGMTGWAQVSGGNAYTWPQRITLDAWYVDHWSWPLDILILWRTLRVVFFGESPDAQALERARAHEARLRQAG
jgi:lipopolysaccharide/colanic/teichoic acid biosynthesis glycosyltransferase